MNKGRRHELKMLKFKKRLKQLQLVASDGNYNAYRSHGAPCSCFVCSHTKYDRQNPKFKKGGVITTDYIYKQVK